MSLRRLTLVLGVFVLIVPVLHAYVAAPDRILSAIAETNKADGRDQAIRLELSMQIGDRPAVATAELISHPTGLARLELRGTGGLLERHLLQGNELTATRNGEPLDEPRAFLLPFFILQADSGVTLRAALASFDVESEAIGLADCGETDCFVIGDLLRAIPRPELPALKGIEEAYGQSSPDELGEDLEEGTAPNPPITDEAIESEGSSWPRVWVETGTYEIRGFDAAAGVRIRLGPVASFDKLRVPAWISVEEPGRAPARFDVLRAARVTAPASAFSREWLFAPDSEMFAPEASPDGPAER